jgi:hypothetical protein
MTYFNICHSIYHQDYRPRELDGRSTDSPGEAGIHCVSVPQFFLPTHLTTRRLVSMFMFCSIQSRTETHDPIPPVIATRSFVRCPPQSRPAQERQSVRRLFERAALWGEDAGGRLRLPAAGDAQRPLPLPRRQEHRRPHRRRPRPLRPRPPHPWLLQRRDRRPPSRRPHSPPPQPRPARRPAQPSRWTWGASSQIRICRRGGPMWPPCGRAAARAPTGGRPCRCR